MMINFAVTIIVTKLTAPPPQDVQDMVLALREPGEGVNG